MADTSQQGMPPQPPPYMYRQPRKTRWWIPVLIIGIVIILFFIAVIAFFSMIGSFFAEEPVEVKQNTVLRIDMQSGVDEYYQASPFEIFGAESPASFYDMLLAVNRAGKDPRIKGIYIDANGARIGFAKALELIETLEEFKSSGKFIYAYMDMGDEAAYMNMLPADKIYMPREGVLEFNGFAVSSMFFKKLLDTIGVDMDVIGFKDFKSAGEPFSRQNFSDSARYQLRVILNERLALFTENVAKYRKIPAEKVHEYLDKGLFSTDSLVDYGLIDGYATEVEVKRMMKAKIYGIESPEDTDGKKLRMMPVRDYLDSEFNEKGKVDFDKQIAIIYGVGTIMPVKDNSPFSGDEKVITTGEFIKYLTKARKNKKIKAIILRIDSPGGSAMASDAIYQEIRKTKDVKPVYVSMSDVAASGGYYMAIGADTIIAHPATITGSIGVITMIPSTYRLFQKLFVGIDTVATNPQATMFKGVMPITRQDYITMYKFAEGLYNRFLEKVAKSRKMDIKEVRAIAKGRVWTGEDALKIGLVDDLGGLQDAIKMAKRRIGIAESATALIKRYPERLEPVQAFLKLFGIDDGQDEDIQLGPKNAMLAGIMQTNPALSNKMYNSLPPSAKEQLNYLLNLLMITSGREYVMAAMPYYLSFE